MATTQSSPVLVQTMAQLPRIDTVADLSRIPLYTETQSQTISEIPIPEPEPETVVTETAPAPVEQAAVTMDDVPVPPTESTDHDRIETAPAEQTVEEPAAPTSEDTPVQAEAATPADPPQTEQPSTESQPAEPEPAPPPSYPEWVTWEDDTSTPTEEELKDNEGTEDNASDIPSMEKKIYDDWHDPEQRPVKKIRLSWQIMGLRGTKERPNMAKVMNSPYAKIDGRYYGIKFFPRGNKSSSLSAYIRCCDHLPTPDTEQQESTFAYFEGPPDADMKNVEPTLRVHVPATPAKEEKGASHPQPEEAGASKDGESVAQVEPEPQVAANDATPPVTPEVKSKPTDDDDYRISAQLGMVIYNPSEPRTCTFNCSEHQFTKHNDDWGWTNFVGPWEKCHIRTRGQRQALVKNDTIAIDAYIRVFHDPSQALWWHASNEHEPNWPSKKLSGYYPMGTPPLYHSPGVAGITAWLLLAPVRNILQNIDAGQWRKSSQIKPRPLIARLQYVLHLMRNLKRDDYVNVNPVIDALKELGESFNDVKSFWEALRRSIEIELEGEAEALKQLSDIFDTPAGKAAVPNLCVKDTGDVQTALAAVQWPKEMQESAPNFLPLMLEREVFEKKTCEWKLCHDRLTLNDEVTMPNGEKYTLYGFHVHVGVRNSGKFYSVLRPNGLGTKWLAFEDGDGNKVFSYTRKRIQEFEGLVGDELKSFKSTRSSAYMAMYIKNSCVQAYMPGKLEDYQIPLWILSDSDERPTDWREQLGKQLGEEDKDGISVEIYHDEGILGRQGLLDMFNVKQQALANKRFWDLKLSAETTFKDIRNDLASRLQVDNVEKLRLFMVSYGDVGQYTSAQWEAVPLTRTVENRASFRRPLCLWLSVLKTDEDIKIFGVPDPVEVKPEKTDAATVEVPVEDQADVGSIDVAAPASQDVAMEESTTDINAPAVVDDIAASIDQQPLPETATEAQAGDQPVEVAAAVPTITLDELLEQQPEISTQELDSQGNDIANTIVELPTEAISTIEPIQDVVHSPEATMEDSTDGVPASEDVSATPEDPVVEAPSSPEAVMEDVPSATDAQTEAMAESLMDLTTSAPVDATESTETVAPPDFTETLETWATEHGHLVDAVMSEAPPAPVDAATIIEQTISSVRDGENQTTADGETDATPQNEPEEEARPEPVVNVYGFLQVFHTDEQNFRVHSTFFAKRHESAKEVVRKCMGYDADKEFHAWHRETTLDGSSVDSKATFDDINFSDGVDIIVGEILSDTKKEELRQQGKFSNPFALSRYLRMAERRHPIHARTSLDPVEIADFGMNYYKGPLVNGQPHGENCYMITPHGHTYKGPLIMNEKSGANGKMTYQNGDIYEGEWKNDERHGQGTLTEKRTGNVYEGGFQNGKRWGKGTTHWKVADEEADMCQICYGEEIDALFFDCGHVCSCVECAKQCDVCPICRRAVRQVVRMFWA